MSATDEISPSRTGTIRENGEEKQTVAESSATVDPSSDNSNVSFGCQFCRESFGHFTDLSEHVQKHFLQDLESLRGSGEQETGPRTRVKNEPEDRMPTSKENLEPERISGDLSSFPETDVAVQENSSTDFEDSSSVALKEDPSVDSPDEENLRTNVKTEVNKPNVDIEKIDNNNASKNKSKRETVKNLKDKCLLCKLVISNIPIQVERHLAVSHYKDQLISKFGLPKSYCPVCGKNLRSRRSWLTHMMVRHTQLPKTMEAVKRSNEVNPPDPKHPSGKRGRKKQARSKNKWQKIVCPKCSLTVGSYYGLVNHFCHAHFDDVKVFKFYTTFFSSSLTMKLNKQGFF
jgi:hypothetical protein